MNDPMNITTATGAANFPIPYPNEDPEDGLREVASLIRVVQEVLNKPGMDICERSDLDTVLWLATERMRPVITYLSLDDRPDSLRRYKSARRHEIQDRGGSNG